MVYHKSPLLQVFGDGITGLAPSVRWADAEEQVWDAVDSDPNLFIVGPEVIGKSTAVASVLKRKLEQYPDALGLVFYPRSDPKEDGYWEHPRIKRLSFRGDTASTAVWEQAASDFCAQVARAIEQVDVTSGKRLFVVFGTMPAYQANLCKEIFDEIVELCISIIMLGDSEGVHAIAVTDYQRWPTE